MTLRFDIAIFEGFDELDVVGPYEVLKSAARLNAPFSIHLVTADSSPSVTAAYGLSISSQGILNAANRPDVLIVPGGGWMDGSPRGARHEAVNGPLPGLLPSLQQAGTVICGVCTGVMILAAAGLTTGRPAVTHHGAIEALRASGCPVRHDRVVDDGNLITCGGVTSGIDLALHLVERFASPEIAERVAANMEYTRTQATATSAA